jgi:hypothetical protein
MSKKHYSKKTGRTCRFRERPFPAVIAESVFTVNYEYPNGFSPGNFEMLLISGEPLNWMPVHQRSADSAWHDISTGLIKMKKSLTPLLALMVIFLNSCAVVGGIFKAGVWVGVLIVVFIIGIIIWLVTRSGKS